MNYISSFIPFSLKETTVKATGLLLGKQYMQSLGHHYGPAAVTKVVTAGLKAVAGNTLGAVIAGPIAPICVTQAMPPLLIGAKIVGGFIGYQGTSAAIKIYKYASEKIQHESDNKKWLADVSSEKHASLGKIVVPFQLKTFYKAPLIA